MFANYQPKFVTPTVSEVLGLLRDRCVQAFHAVHGRAPYFEITLSTTVDDWMFYGNLLKWNHLAECLNKEFKINEPLEVWRQVMTPERKKTLEDVCEFLAPRIKVPRVRVVEVAGKRCLPASAFLAVKSLLGFHGVCVEDIAPSTPLDSYTRDHYQVFITKISAMIEGGLPTCKVQTRPASGFAHFLEIVWKASIVLAVAGSLMLVPALIFDAGYAWPMGILLVGLGYLGAYACAKWTPLRLVTSVTFSGLHTFRDLSKYVASRIEDDNLDLAIDGHRAS